MAMSEPRPPRRFRTTLLLAAALSAMLVVGWVGFMVLAPSPRLTAPAAGPEVLRPPESVPALRIMAPADVLPAELIQQFENQRGTHIVIDIIPDDEEALRRFIDAPPDAAIVSGVGLARLAADERLAALSPNRIPAAGTLDPSLVAIGANYDAGNRHSLMFGWRALGLAYDGPAIQQRLGDAAKQPSWRWLFDPAPAAKLADCGIVADDDVVEAFAAALAHLGRPISSQNVGDYEAAAQTWERVRPMIAAFGAGEAEARLADGRACLALTSSDTAYRAGAAARLHASAAALTFTVPREGALARDLFLVIPANARDPRPAEALFSFLLRPEIAAQITARTGLITAVPRGIVALPSEIRSDPALRLSRIGLVREVDPGPRLRGLRERYWHLIDAPGLPAPAQ